MDQLRDSKFAKAYAEYDRLRWQYYLSLIAAIVWAASIMGIMSLFNFKDYSPQAIIPFALVAAGCLPCAVVNWVTHYKLFRFDARSAANGSPRRFV